ncbi:MAG TPA: hypothetical protein VG247_27240 [Pseudonocardiaceae bacterium]|nr:hypothetical protein [Pseudonocardiaceae bacterium]
MNDERYEDPDWPPRPADMAAWLRAGLRRTDALAWHRWNFDLQDALSWIAAGVSDSLVAAQWQTAGVNPGTVTGWHAAGIDATEAVHWHELGFDLDAAREHRANGRDPQQAYCVDRPSWFSPGSTPPEFEAFGAGEAMREFLRAGVSGTLIGGYLQAQWVDPEALVWAKHGVAVHEAQVWRELGLTPAEAAELSSAGTTPVEVIREWWRAGIPFDEVADWIGAGLDAEAASVQRERGITAADAAQLRARRRLDPPAR